ncbi:MAG: TonB-dependent receptor plug domain-containing protein, partial [Sporomusa sp.]
MKRGKSKKQRHAWLCAMVAGTLLWQMPGITHAEEVDEYEFDQIVVTANRVPTKVAESAANVKVINRDEIEQGHYQNLRQLLQNVNGVIVTGQGQPGAKNIVRLNGNDRVVIMIDGRRVNMDKGAASGRAGYDLNGLPTLTNIERIEIVKGAASALYGSDAVGGVINIITRQGIENQTTIDISTGSWGIRDYELTHQGTEQGWSWFLTAGRHEQDHFAYKDFVSGKTKDMPNSDYNQENLTFRLDKEIGENKSITLDVEHANDKGGQPYMPPGFANKYGSQHHPFARQTSITNNWALTYNFDKGMETAGFMRVYQNYYSSDSSNPEDKYEPFTSYSNKASGVEWQDTWRIDERNLLVGGAEWRESKVDNLGLYSGSKVKNKAMYLEDRMILDRKWTFTPGVRYDRHNMFGSKTTPRAAVNYKMDDDTNMYVSWGKVFNAPNTDDLYWPNQNGLVGNPNLKPETGYSTTIGINKKLNDKTEVSASYFQSKLKDAIVWRDRGDYTYTPVNYDKQRKEGFELEIRTR